MNADMRRYAAELVGTFVLVFGGVGSAVLAGDKIGPLGVALAFGLTLLAMAYAIGPISGCHINPAVTAGLVSAGRMPINQGVAYMAAQMLGALAGAVLLYLILSGKIAGYSLARSGLGQNGWGANYLGGFNLTAALITEVIATFIFVFVILRATGERGPGPLAGLIVGLTLVALHFPFINVTGLSVNPARSFGPAVVVGGQALAQVWLFVVAPVVGGLLAGVVDRMTERKAPASARRK